VYLYELSHDLNPGSQIFSDYRKFWDDDQEGGALPTPKTPLRATIDSMNLFTQYYLVIGAILLALSFASPVLAQVDYDPDGDGLSSAVEMTVYYTNPNSWDTDGDGYSDDAEIRGGYSPRHTGATKLAEVDTDSDGLNDDLEIRLGTDLMVGDTDRDSHLDGKEVYSGYNPLSSEPVRMIGKRVVVDLSDQHLHYFIGDVWVGKMAVSSGQRITPTPLGEFAIERKVPAVHYRGADYDYPNTKWNLQFKPHYYLHGAYWHNQFGKKPMSHGCVNIAYPDAERLYSFLDVGDKVMVVGVTPSGVIR